MDRRHSLRLLLPAVLIIAAAASSPSLRHVRAEQMNATYAGGKLAVSIPYHSDHAGSGHLVTEILDPEDHVLGRVERNLDIGKGDGSWRETVTPNDPIPFADIVWQRLRYRFEYVGNAAPAIGGVASISEVLRRPVVRILGQTAYLSGSRAAIRVIVSDATNNDTFETGSVHIELLSSDGEPNLAPRQLFSGNLNHHGTVEAQFRFPAGLTGKYSLHYIADTPIGSTEFTQPIELNDKSSILLTTEKPIYQPGQTIHVRALALDRADMKAVGDCKLTFEVEDSRGNKVFKKVTQTDNFGIASAEFALADEVNLGTYHLRAVLSDPMGDAQAPANTAEIALNVDRYTLPKFKVAVDFTEANGKPKRDFRPGDHVTGTVRANYFFGKPVDHAEIALKASTMDVAIVEVVSATGKTDADGAYKFDLKLPGYFAGKPLTQGAARALVEASVKDSADHTETRGEPITISEAPLLITAVPEGGTLIPRIENQVFLLSAYPDGTPAITTLTVHIPGESGGHTQQVTTDSGGVAVVRFNPTSNVESLRIDADDHRGNRASSDVPLETRVGSDQVLLRTDHAILKAGDPIHLKVLSTRARGSAYVDIVKNGQTILTRDLDLENGQAELTLTATPEMAGTLDIDAYLFGRDAQPVADHRLIFVQPADELKIEATADAAVYKPGSDARVRFHVTNSRGEGVSAALGVQVVDEAVFALAEKQPGFAKVFFYLEQEVMKPRFEIHSLSMPEIVRPVSEGRSDGAQQNDLAARALFSATEMANPTRLDTEFGRTLPQDRYAEYTQRYREAFTAQVKQLAEALNRDLEHRPSGTDLVRVYSNVSQPLDAWGTPIRMEPARWRSHRRGVDEAVYVVRSAGPDHQFSNADDLTVYLEESAKAVVSPGGQDQQGGTLDLAIEHDRGPFNGRAEISGTVTDATGAIVPGATITLVSLSTHGTRIAYSNATGQFMLSGLDPGRYEARVTSPGFEIATRAFDLKARDRAVLATTLQVGSSTETVTVSSEPFRISAGTMHGARGAMGGPVALAKAAAPQMQFMMEAANVDVNGAAVADLPISGRNSSERVTAAPAAPHVRSYFPEALYINPEILTDGHGDASISIPIADSITTWRMAMIASTKNGALGTGTTGIKVFQDFFVDLDLPVTLTQGDRVSIPVGIYNYSGKPGKVSLKLTSDTWFSLDNDTADKSLEVESGRVGASQFTINANRIGKFKLTLSAHMDGVEGRDDIVVREIEVIPNGREQDVVFNGRLDKEVQRELPLPPNAITDATSVLVRLYPGPLSQVIEGMDSILRMPGGCFEQTSSSTYPNVLALDYMKRTKKLTPEVHAKAEGFIANGYQRLLTFEVPGGGFSWFGQAPANKILTAYGLMEFSDMAKVSEVDPKLISRTAEWLASQQQPDGSWKPDSNFINEGATNRYNTDVVRITAYIAWALETNAAYRGPAIEKAKQYLEAHPVGPHPAPLADGAQTDAARAAVRPDAYTLAVIANFAADYALAHPDAKQFEQRAMQALLDARFDRGDESFWTTDESGFRSTGPSAAVETTGLAVQALLKSGDAPEVVRKALAFLSSTKQASGNWGTTQATIMALRALLAAAEIGSSDVRGAVEVTLNGKHVETLKLTPENNDLLHQFVFKLPGLQSGEIESSGVNSASRIPANSVGLRFEGTGSLAYQIVGRSFIPYDRKPAPEALAIDVAYDRTKLAENDIATAKVTIRNNLDKTANMVMVDLGIPPGFDLLSEDLQSFQEKSPAAQPGHLEKFSLTATQAILYFNSLAPGQTVTMSVRLRAKYPIRARTFQSRVYEYYAPEVSATAQPVQLEVSRR